MIRNSCMNDDFKIVIFVPNLITHHWGYSLHCDIPVALRSMNLFLVMVAMNVFYQRACFIFYRHGLY